LIVLCFGKNRNIGPVNGFAKRDHGVKNPFGACAKGGTGNGAGAVKDGSRAVHNPSGKLGKHGVGYTEQDDVVGTEVG
jgi:hypothetical protein